MGFKRSDLSVLIREQYPLIPLLVILVNEVKKPAL